MQQAREQYDPYQDATNRMQHDLMKASGNPMKWVEDKAGDFRKIIAEEPGLLDLYLENPEKFREEMKKRFEKLDKETLH
jgi:hypothetical protein